MPALLQPPRPDAAHPKIHWHALHGSARALALAEAAAADTRLYLIIAADARSLDELARELSFFGAGTVAQLQLPDWEVLPYDLFSPHPDTVSERLASLARLPTLRSGILLVAAETLLQRLPPRQFIDSRSFEVVRGQRFALEEVRTRLAASGYAAVSQVAAPGEFALRGSLFDVYPMGSATPLRIDLFDDEIETIRRFDPETQRSLEKIERITLLPARELPLDEESVRAFRRRYRIRFEGDPTRSEIYRGVSEGLAPPGIEFYLPLFFDACATLFDYLPAGTVVASEGDVAGILTDVWAGIETRYEERRHDIQRPVLEPQELFLPVAEAMSALQACAAIEMHVFRNATDAGDGSCATDFPTAAPRTLRLDARAEQPLAPLLEFLDTHPGRVLLAADSPGRREVLLEMLAAHARAARQVAGWQEFIATDAALSITIAPDVAGLTLLRPPVTVLADSQLFGQRARQERRRRRSVSDPDAILRDLQALDAGAPVVHEEYGVGRYVGLQVMQVAGQSGEFLVLEYQGGDRIYVPVQALHLISRYTGAAPESAPLHKLGTDQWARARRRATEQIRDVAAELLDLYARRQARTGLKLSVSEQDYQAFASGFAFEETADQAEAIDRVIVDLASERPMDRIVCGDVGFGKTEVAMRAAFVAVQSGKQVAVLVPTTLLAEQHVTTFRDRFANWPVRVESLSRFRGGKESKAILDGIAAGTVDIVIATHRLLHADANFKDLGLMIIDEEHRFGVRDKERLKALRAEVHVLTLTATPIPRTLNMALGGLRELSLITTPPPSRLAIKTFVTEWRPAGIREACLRELRRGGQIYFVHNEIETIEKMAAELAALVPEASVRVGHGQMRERDLEQLMVDFYHRRFNLLLCTTIIESGIDVPTANTIMINRADRLGLAQLHQLRGRVGRSHHRAYAYLIVPSRRALSGDAAKRLEAIESLEELGAGFVLATHDLEIRGAGEFLGESQSGELTEVGLALYLDMLERAVAALKQGKEPDFDRPMVAATEVDLHMPSLLPADYIDDVHVRLSLYKRIAAAPDGAALDDLTTELVDRFGPLPEPAHTLLRIARLAQTARGAGIRRLDVGATASHVVFEPENHVDPARVIKLVQTEGREFRLDGPLKLRVARGATEPLRFDFAASLLRKLTGTAVP
jgi:transcription-repair coupling factor (superfamily II helicase)